MFAHAPGPAPWRRTGRSVRESKAWIDGLAAQIQAVVGADNRGTEQARGLAGEIVPHCRDEPPCGTPEEGRDG